MEELSGEERQRRRSEMVKMQPIAMVATGWLSAADQADQADPVTPPSFWE